MEGVAWSDAAGHRRPEGAGPTPRRRGDRAMDAVMVCGTLAGLVAEVLLLAGLIVALVEGIDNDSKPDNTPGGADCSGSVARLLRWRPRDRTRRAGHQGLRGGRDRGARPR